MHRWDHDVAGYLSHLTAAGTPNTTRETRRHHLGRVARGVEAGPFELSADALVEWAAAQQWAPETRRAHRTTLRSFYRWSVETGRTEENIALALPAVRATSPNPRPVSDEAYRLALARAEENVRLMVRLASELGMRRAEVAQVHSRDLVEDLDGWSLVVHGKGGKTRVLPMPRGLALMLRERAAGYAFPGNDSGHLSPRWVGKLVGRALPDGWTMHQLRHRFASRAYRYDRDVFTVQDLLGHASPDTTRRYVAVPNESLRRTVEAIA